MYLRLMKDFQLAWLHLQKIKTCVLVLQSGHRIAQMFYYNQGSDSRIPRNLLQEPLVNPLRSSQKGKERNLAERYGLILDIELCGVNLRIRA